MKIDSAMPIFDRGLFKNTNMGKQKDEVFNNKLKINEKEKSFSEMLQEQILKLKERKEVVQNNEKFTVEEKKNKLDEINKQLSELQEQLLQANIMEKEKELEEKNDKLREANEKNQELQEELNGDIKKDGIIIAKSLVKLINSNNYIENAHELNITKESMKTELSYLEMKNVPREDWSFNNKQATKLRNNINSLKNASMNATAKSIKYTKEEKEDNNKDTIEKKEKEDIYFEDNK